MLTGRWVLTVWNAEYFFFPFCEDRIIGDVIMFAKDENRTSVHAITVDLYGTDDHTAAGVFNPSDCYFDAAGYFSEDRFDGANRLVRQKNIFGGLKWRFAQHIPWERQRVDRVPLFMVGEDTQFEDDGRLKDPEQNTLECAWHNSLTGAVASFRVAKSLLRNPGSQFEATSFMWSQSQKFEGTSLQLMNAGFMEPGQWF